MASFKPRPGGVKRYETLKDDEARRLLKNYETQ